MSDRLLEIRSGTPPTRQGLSPIIPIFGRRLLTSIDIKFTNFAAISQWPGSLAAFYPNPATPQQNFVETKDKTGASGKKRQLQTKLLMSDRLLITHK
ncbi:MAG: hypothetical protein A2270_00270 [Elusimicrobia bacterium RIFOXYA12_FULL_51_18]|nr:MAG: hypothetical protein A2270_00270 [Elusimicrobia bacterium RIFOXYA12_FULL_51_18]OGS31530.1 MAG: hypothetical protein A2218_09740 [Elusimicrobia bacterium RIFOXYA2_FULL_53_38]